MQYIYIYNHMIDAMDNQGRLMQVCVVVSCAMEVIWKQNKECNAICGSLAFGYVLLNHSRKQEMP